jgi:8-oxo-dGTP pyrophosphatase MutT (NUDIX family)
MTVDVIAMDWRVRERRARRKDGWQTSGGVVVDVSTGRVLLVRNRRDMALGRGGWTWPKGRIDLGEGPVFAALREIAEEAGVLAEPLGRIALIQTKRALRHYFLLSVIQKGLPFDPETIALRWATFKEARKLLDRKRDRRVLKAARHMLRRLTDAS